MVRKINIKSFVLAWVDLLMKFRQVSYFLKNYICCCLKLRMIHRLDCSNNCTTGYVSYSHHFIFFVTC
jgi:hypothetical protein